ncbi:PTS sugar transporter subunit IIA [Celerinatantimonas yamalensis]|uniref:PTS sugar transporter subunit IIA n=1 Tax=Celerinatantimonas yamalensis TaxID=559956 RepID=A0ABW9G548_9GAMM
MFNRLFKSTPHLSRPLFDISHIIYDNDSTDKRQALAFIARNVMQAGYVRSDTVFLNDLLAREAQSSTGFKDAIATPHAKSKQVLHAGIWVCQFSHHIAWETMDEKPVKVAVALLIPATNDQAAMLPLISISRANMRDDFRRILTSEQPNEIDQAILRAIEGTR